MYTFVLSRYSNHIFIRALYSFDFKIENMVTFTFPELLDQKPHLFEKAIRKWKEANTLQPLYELSPASIGFLMSLSLEEIGYRCFPDYSSGRYGASQLIQDPLRQKIFHLRVVHCSSIPIGKTILAKLVGSMEGIRVHDVIFVLIYEYTENCYTRGARSYMEKSQHYQFIDGTELMKKVYSMS